MSDSIVDALVKLVVGKLGAGKTAYAVAKMLEALMAGQVVVSNVLLKRAECEAYFGKVKVPWQNYRFVSSDDIGKDPNVLLGHLCAGACLVIDEIHLFLNARKWRENMTKAEQFLLFLTQARKFSIDCYILTQDERNADAQLVRMATNIIRLVNWRHLPLLGVLIPLPLTVARICKPDGVTSVGKEYVWRRMALLRCYDTHQKFNGLEVTGAVAAPVLGKKAKHMSYGAVLMGAGACCVIISYAFTWKSEKARKEKEALEAVKVAEREARRVQVTAAKPAVVAAPVVQGGYKPDRVEAVTRAERARIESELPPVYRYNSAMIVLVGGEVIGHGTYFLAGTVKGWKSDGGTLLVTLNSQEIPQLRLFHGNKPRPFLYNFEGGLIRRPGRSDRGVAPSLAPGSPAMAPGGGGPTLSAPQLYIPGGAGQSPQLVVPPGDLRPSTLEQMEAGIERLDRAPPADGGPRL